MTATVEREKRLTSLAEYLASVLRRLSPLAPLDVEVTQLHRASAYGHVLADDVVAAHQWPAYDCAALDGYAVNAEDLVGTTRLSVIGDLAASSWRPSRLTPGTCFSVAAGAPLPAAADTVVPAEWTDRGMAAVEIRQAAQRGHGVRRAGDTFASGAVLAPAGTLITPALVGALVAAGVTTVTVRCVPRVVVVATGDELVHGGAGHPGRVEDVSSYALAAAVAEAGGQPYRAGICEDEPERLRNLLDDQTLRADLIITTGGTGTGPGDIVRRVLSARQGARAGSVAFTDLAVYPCGVLGFGTIGSAEVPIICLPGDPGTAMIGFELLGRPAVQLLAGAEPVFRPSVRGHLLEAVQSPAGLREFRPAKVSERRGGGYTVQPLPGGPYTLAGLAQGNALAVLGERISSVPVGTDVDVMLLDRRR